MKLLFMGTPDFAATILEKLINSGHEMIGVVTQPDKQKGRGNEISCLEVKKLALQHGLPVYQPLKVKDPEFIEMVKELAPDVIVSAAFGQILPRTFLEIPPYGCINVHASLLPQYRGAAPIQYSVINGETETGITIMYMDAGIDTGDIILQESLAISQDETGGSLFDKLAVLGSELIVKALGQIADNTAVRTPQDNEKATYVKVIDKEMGRLDFSWSAVRLERLIRGLNPWPSAFTLLDGKTLKLWQAQVENNSMTANRESVQPGTVVEIRKDALVIQTGEGLLVIKELQLEGKKRMAADAFLRGYTVTVGTKLG